MLTDAAVKNCARAQLERCVRASVLEDHYLLSGTSSSPLSAMIARESLGDHWRLAGDLKINRSGVADDLGAAGD